MSSMSQGLSFLVNVLFGLYGSVIVLRILLHSVQADFNNSLVQFVVKLTDKPTQLFKKFIPEVGKIEWASVVLLLCVMAVKVLLLSLLSGRVPGVVGLLIWATGLMVKQLLQIMLYLVIIRSIVSWVSINASSIIDALIAITEPIMAPARRYIPTLGAFDVSPIAVLIILQLLLIIIADPLTRWGIVAALGL